VLNIILIILGIVILLGLIGLAVALGYFWRDIRTSLSAVRSRLANLEETDLPEPAIIDPKTPQELKEHQYDQDDEESAIVVAKKPRDLRREKDQKLTEDLNRISGQ
jgi:Sec-independent protein translocase protein TatA